MAHSHFSFQHKSNAFQSINNPPYNSYIKRNSKTHLQTLYKSNHNAILGGLYLMQSHIVPPQLHNISYTYIYIAEIYFNEKQFIQKKKCIGFEKPNHFAENQSSLLKREIRVRVSERVKDSVKSQCELISS